MAVIAISRPLGHKISTTPITAVVSDDSGDALFYSVGHGLTDEYVYIESNIDSYNGFFFISSGFGADSFKILVNENDADFVQFKQTADVLYYKSERDHGWQCVHLPIVYELESDLYPVNSVDTVITISAYGDVNGYFAVTHSALTGSDELFALDYVELSDGRVLQVVEIASSTITVLNFDGSGSLSTMQKVRNNYHILVNVYAGLPAGHRWETEKPYELATTLRFIPDSNNIIKFSIAEILKGYITTRNNLTLDSLPNNIDFLTAFYIEFTEAYDVSSGTEVTVFEDEFEVDDFEGYAVNAMLPFKNIYSGWMSSYIHSLVVPGRWLTTMDRPIIWNNYFFDISFINTAEGFIIIQKNGADYLILDNPGIGILRIPVEPSGETEICLIAYSNLLLLSSGVNDGTINTAWTLGNNPTVTTTVGNSQRLLFDYATSSITIPYNLTVSVVGSEIVRVRFSLTDALGTTDIDTEDVDFNSSGVKTGSVTLSGAGFMIGVKTFSISGGGSRTVTINSLFENIQLTEEICMDVINECDDSLIADNLRLIETGPFRELE